MSGQVFKIENTGSLLTWVSRYSSSLVDVYFKNSGFVVLIFSTSCGLFWGFFGVMFFFCFCGFSCFLLLLWFFIVVSLSTSLLNSFPHSHLSVFCTLYLKSQ